MVRIERNVPMEPAHNKAKYPFRQLEIGESFFIPDTTQANIATMAWRWSKKLGRKYETRKRPGGVRVWRTE